MKETPTSLIQLLVAVMRLQRGASCPLYRPIDFHPNVAAVIRGAPSLGGSDDIFYDDVDEMTALTIEGIAVDDLRGIDCIVNLRTLRANSNNLGSSPTAMDALLNLKKLQTLCRKQWLVLSGILKQFVDGSELNLGDNEIVAIDALAGMTELGLSLQNNQNQNVSLWQV